MKPGMLATFANWFETHRSSLSQAETSLDLSAGTDGALNNSIYAELRNDRYEWLAQLWEDGLADFHFLDWTRPDDGVEVTHYEFAGEHELIVALEQTLDRMLQKTDTT